MRAGIASCRELTWRVYCFPRLPQGDAAKPAAALEPIPEVEWWDARILVDKSYGGVLDGEPVQVGTVLVGGCWLRLVVGRRSYGGVLDGEPAQVRSCWVLLLYRCAVGLHGPWQARATMEGGWTARRRRWTAVC